MGSKDGFHSEVNLRLKSDLIDGIKTEYSNYSTVASSNEEIHILFTIQELTQMEFSGDKPTIPVTPVASVMMSHGQARKLALTLLKAVDEFSASMEISRAEKE